MANNIKFQIMAKRSQKTTTQQFEELLNFVESNKDVLCSRTFNKYMKVKLWQMFANNINAKRLGPPKTAGQWRKVFNEWKVNTKRKMKGRNQKTVLSDLQQRLLHLISQNSSEGDYIVEEYKRDSAATCSSPVQENATLAEDPTLQQIPGLSVIKQEQLDESNVFDPTDCEEDNVTVAMPTEQTDHIYTTKSASSSHNSCLDLGSLTADAVNNLASAINNLAEAKKKEAEALHLLAKAKLLSAKAKHYELCNNKSLKDLDI